MGVRAEMMQGRWVEMSFSPSQENLQTSMCMSSKVCAAFGAWCLELSECKGSFRAVRAGRPESHQT